MSDGNEMICQPVTLSGYAEWPKVADAVIEACEGLRGATERPLPRDGKESEDGRATGAE